MNFLSKSAIILGSVAFALGCLFFRYIPNKWYKPKSTYYSTLIEHNKNQENQIIRDNEDIDKLNKNVILLEDQIKFLRAQIKKIEQETYYEFIRELPFRMDDERVQELIKAFEKIINELTDALGKKDSIIIDKDALIARLQAIINDLTNELGKKDSIIKDKDAFIKSLQAIINDLRNQLADESGKKDSIIKDKDALIKRLQAIIDDLQNQLTDALGKKDSIIKDKDASIEELQALINDLKNQLKNKDSIIKARDAAIDSLEKLIIYLRDELNKKDSIIKDKDASIEKLQALINDLQNQLKDKYALIEKIQAIIKDLKVTLLNRDSEIEELQTFIKNLQTQLQQKDKELMDKQAFFEILELRNKALEQEIQKLKQTINDLKNQLANKDALIKDKDIIIRTLNDKIDRLQAIINDLQNQLKDKKTQPILNDFKLLQPYLTYTADGDTIREYKLFPEMFPKEKDHAGRVNYFHRQDFLNLYEKYQLNIFPTKWTTNKENLGNLEYNQDGTIKTKYEWKVSKANYNIIFTNQSTNPPNVMTYNFITKHYSSSPGFHNKSFCFLDLVSDFKLATYDKMYDINYLSPFEDFPYIRFITKNLECEFDWLVFIICSFSHHFYSNFKVLDEFMYYTTTHDESIEKLAENPVRNNLPANERLFTIEKTPKRIIVKEGTPDQHIKTIDIIEIKYDLKTLVDKVNNLHLATEKEKKNREFINQYALNNQPLISNGVNDLI